LLPAFSQAGDGVPKVIEQNPFAFKNSSLKNMSFDYSSKSPIIKIQNDKDDDFKLPEISHDRSEFLPKIHSTRSRHLMQLKSDFTTQ